MDPKTPLDKVYAEATQMRKETASYITDMRKLMLKYAEEDNVRKLDALDAILRLLRLLKEVDCKTVEDAEEWILYGREPAQNDNAEKAN